MDSYKAAVIKANVIKADEIIDSGKPVSLFGSFSDSRLAEYNQPVDADSLPVAKQTPEEKLKSEMQEHLNRVSDECYRRGFAEGVEFQKKDVLPVLESLSSITSRIPQIRKEIIAKSEEHIVRLALGIAEKILNQEVATRKDLIVGVLQGVMKNVSATDGLKIRLNPQDFRFIMEVRKDFLQSIDGVRNVVFEEDVSIKRGGAVVETMFGEVDGRLESQLKEIRAALLKT